MLYVPNQPYEAEFGVNGMEGWGVNGVAVESVLFLNNPDSENPVHVRDLHGTMLHQPGVDHQKLTFRYQALDQWLTGAEEVRVLGDLIARGGWGEWTGGGGPLCGWCENLGQGWFPA